MTIPRPSLVGRTPGRRVPLYIDGDIVRSLAKVLPRPTPRQPLGLVTDRIVNDLHASALVKSLRDAGWRVHKTVLVPGESIKSQRVIDRLHTEWFANDFDRYTPVIALGGGTIGDAVGFAAATFLRGIPLWHVPTTIVGQVDSAIGGKVGINHVRGKNLIGCFYQPTGIIIDPNLLGTLPAREIRAGLAEVLKYGIIADARLFERCANKAADWISKDASLDIATITACAAIKLRVVAEDEFDVGLRHILNFGHTLGHAFERWGQYRVLRHGEAVTLGMVAASQIAASRGLLPTPSFDRILNACRAIAPDGRVSRFEPAQVLSYLGADKKRKAGRNLWVLPTKVGRVVIVRDVADKEIRNAVQLTRDWLRANT